MSKPQRIRGFLLFVLLLALPACGSATDNASADAVGGASASGGAAGTAASGGGAGTAPGGAGGSIASGGSAGAPSGGGAAGEATGGAAGTSAGGGAGTPPGNAALATLGALVVLGDSISDGGGQAPYYYDELKQDLTAKYGAITYKNHAQSGSKTGALKGQISGLPSSLPGPVAVVITSGGNDMKDNLFAIIGGTDQAARAQMGTNISNALAELLSPGRFGAGVAVHVFEANIYDASDGQGNFGQNGCAFGKGLPAIPCDAYFDSWNVEIATQVLAKGQWLVDIHESFRPHGFNHPPSWYASDCTHPNATGHDQLRRYFYEKITGETLP